jgi:hypothetical protein
MPLGPSQVIYMPHQTTPTEALANLMGGIQDRRDADQAAQDKQDQIDAARKQQMALLLIGHIYNSQGINGVKDFLADNPDVAHFSLRPDSSSDALLHAESVRLLSTPDDPQQAQAKGMTPLTMAERIQKHSMVNGLGAAGQKAALAGFVGGDQSAVNATNIETGQAQSSYQQAESDERLRHNITEEGQTGPERVSATSRNYAQGRAAGELATNRSQERDASSPYIQTQIAKSVGTAAGESAIPTRPSPNKPGSPEWSANDFERRARDLEEKAAGTAKANLAQSLLDQAKAYRGRAANIRRVTAPPVAPVTPAVAPSVPASPIPSIIRKNMPDHPDPLGINQDQQNDDETDDNQ